MSLISTAKKLDTSSITTRKYGENKYSCNHQIKKLFNKAGLAQLAELISSSQLRLSEQDALWFYHHHDLFLLGDLANRVNYSKNKDRVYYNINRHINPTNICVYDCKFCAFAKRPNDPSAYAYSIEQILDRVDQALEQGANEIHMVGGLHPRWNFDHFLNIIREVKKKAPKVHLKGFTAVEISWLAKKSRKSLNDTICAMKDAGLDSIPGGGAEIFAKDIRQEITAKISDEKWLQVHRIAHNLGLKSNATMLYGHIEKIHHRVDHLRLLRELQHSTKGFNAFIPLSFQPHNNYMGIDQYTKGIDDLKTIAISRLYLDNFLHIKAYWIMLGQDIAQLALQFGANDFDGSVTEEKIAKSAGGNSGEHLSKDHLNRLIIDVGKQPFIRNSIYNKFDKINTYIDHSNYKDCIDSFTDVDSKKLYNKVCLSLGISKDKNIFDGKYFLQILEKASEINDLYHFDGLSIALFKRIDHLFDDSCDQDNSTYHHSIKNYNYLVHRFILKEKNQLLSSSCNGLFQRIVVWIERQMDQYKSYGQWYHVISYNDLSRIFQKDLQQIKQVIDNLSAIDKLIIDIDYDQNSGINDYQQLVDIYHDLSGCIKKQAVIISRLVLRSDPIKGLDFFEFFSDLNKFIIFVNSSKILHLIKYLEISCEENNSITIHQYLQALSIARIACGGVKICAPYSVLPSNINLKSSSGFDKKANDIKNKVAGILAKSSVNSLGLVNKEHIDDYGLDTLSDIFSKEGIDFQIL